MWTWTNLEFHAHCHGNGAATHPRHPDQTQGASASPVHEHHLWHAETLLSRWMRGHVFRISRFVHGCSFCFFFLMSFVSHGRLRKATHRRYCEDGVDHADSNGGVDGLTDAGHFKDGRRVVKDLGSRKRKRVSEQKKNVACAQHSALHRKRVFSFWFFA